MTLTKDSTLRTCFAVALEPGASPSLAQTTRMTEPTSATWPDQSGPSSHVIAHQQRSPKQRPATPSQSPAPNKDKDKAEPDRTIDEAGAQWLPNADESDEESPLRLTLTRASSEAGDERWQPMVERVRLASGKRVPGTRYRIVRWIGEGGMGMVFEAVHVDIQRPVALKILKPAVAGAQHQRDRFLEEARAVAQVESRFVVDVLDFGELPDGRPFYTMELLQPVSLYDELRNGPLPLERAIPILRQCCKALAAVHARGFVHRDVKPQNVLIQREDGRSDAVRIVDFGIAARIGSNPRIAGTAIYMAPEQIRGVDFDARVDIYGLGCVAYELLTGLTPFEGASATEVVQRHLDDPVIPPSERLAGLPPVVDAVLLRCLAKRPEHRYASMHELEAALCEVQIAVGFTTAWDDLPLPAIPEAERAELHRRMPLAHTAGRRRLGPRVRMAAGAFVVGLISAVGLLSIDRDRAEELPSGDAAAAMRGVEARVADARIAASRAYWAYPPAEQPDYPTALRMIHALDGEHGPLRYLARARAEELREEFAETLVRLGDQYWVAANGRPFAVEYYAQALLFDEAHARARERSNLTATQLADVSARAITGKLSRAELDAGELLRALAEPDPSRRRARVEELLAKSSSPSPLHAQLAALVGLAEPSAASEATVAADEAALPDEATARVGAGGVERKPTAAERPSNSQQAKSYARRAATALGQGNRDQAEGLFTKALTLDPQLAQAHAGLAEIHFARARYESAVYAARKAVRARPNDAALQLLLGDACLKTRRYAEARSAYERAVEMGHGKAKQRLRKLDEVAPAKPGAAP
jgi:tetratricopeptide (TPR) repeat protein